MKSLTPPFLFFKQRCYYCDFPISVVGADTSRPGAKNAIDRYLDSLAIELDSGGGGALDGGIANIGTTLKTIYLGGGTPSLLEPRQVDRILSALDKRFGIASDAEISMEMDPGTFDLAKVCRSPPPAAPARCNHPLHVCARVGTALKRPAHFEETRIFPISTHLETLQDI